MTLTHCLPRHVPMIALIFGIVTLLIVGVFALLINVGVLGNNILVKLLVALISFSLAIILFAMLCYYNNEIKFQGVMLEYAKRFLSEWPMSFAYIPVYLLFTIGLVALFIFQHLAFSCISHQDNNFFKFDNPFIWGVINILEFIWGFQFLRDSFNFCVSGNATDWYFTREAKCYSSYSRLVTRHWGSVVGGSFFNAFLEIPTLLLELLVCHPATCCNKLGTTCSKACPSILNLARTDAYSYINLAGVPYCNAARICESLCKRTNLFVGSHSAIKHYRFGAHVFCVSLLCILGFLILAVRVFPPAIGLWHLITGVVVAYITVTWFIDIHANAAEGLQTAYLVEEHMSGGPPYMQHCIPSFRRELEFLSKRQTGDGNC